jgi:hypothetical protein
MLTFHRATAKATAPFEWKQHLQPAATYPFKLCELVGQLKTQLRKYSGYCQGAIWKVLADVCLLLIETEKYNGEPASNKKKPSQTNNISTNDSFQ